MNAKNTLEKINNTNLKNANLKCCLVTKEKLPVKIDGTMAKPNCLSDFLILSDLSQCINLEDYAGIGLSIQGSQICAIDIDHCFSVPNDINSADNRAIDILDMFKNKTYCEFSFSGTGLRILFKFDLIENYSDKYYIKNEKTQCEYYQPSKSFRYVTITGNAIYDKPIQIIDSDTLYSFLNKYMLKPPVKKVETNTQKHETRTFEQLLGITKFLYLKNITFQNLWFSHAPGSGSDESERDYRIIAFLFEEITQDKNMIKQLFELSPYFKSKDYKHISKWNNQDGRYFNYVYEQIRRTHT